MTTLADYSVLTDELSVTIETIYPELAAQYLERNRNPRKLRPHLVARYAEDMTAGDFPSGTGNIVFDEAGDLRDGQHRLQACLDSGEGFTTIVVRGVSEAAVNYIDRGVKRSLADVLRGQGEVSVSHLQAAVNTGFRWDNGGILSASVPTVAQALSWLELNPGIRPAVNQAYSALQPPLRLRVSIVAPFVYRINLIDEVKAEEFLRLLVTGASLDFQSPVLRLREAFLNRRYGLQTRKEADLALAIKAWNAWITNRPIRNLKWIQQGERTEPFPVLVDCLDQPYPFPETTGEDPR